MRSRTFRFRLRSSHPAPERSSTNLVVEFFNDSDLWEPQQLNFTMPGFRLYLISLLLCQHFYLVANARERHIPLEQVEADFVVTTSSDWIVTAVEGESGSCSMPLPASRSSSWPMPRLWPSSRSA